MAMRTDDAIAKVVKTRDNLNSHKGDLALIVNAPIGHISPIICVAENAEMERSGLDLRIFYKGEAYLLEKGKLVPDAKFRLDGSKQLGYVAFHAGNVASRVYIGREDVQRVLQEAYRFNGPLPLEFT